MPPWWGSRTNVSKRLRVEVEAMRSTFGDTYRPLPESGLFAVDWYKRCTGAQLFLSDRPAAANRNHASPIRTRQMC